MKQVDGESYLCDHDSRAALWAVLTKIDEEQAAQARSQGCACGDVLHRADYPRKPRCMGVEVKRVSFCCAEEGCRKRMTPASVRFLGRRVYAGFIVVLFSALQHGLTPARVAAIQEHLGVDRRTMQRWREWWLEDFARSAPWRTQRGRLVPPPDESALPGSLWERFCAVSASPLLDLLRFLGPWSTPAPSG